MKKLLFSLLMLAGLTSCNKDVDQPGDIMQSAPTGVTLQEQMKNNAADSLFYRLLIHGGQESLIADSNKQFTVFVPDNQAMKRFINAASGGLVPILAPDFVFSQFITTALTPVQAAGLVQYNIIPQYIKSINIGSGFPNFPYPSCINPAPTVSPFTRLNLYPSKQNGAWLNILPITGVDQLTRNGVIHHTAGLAVPPQKMLWERINADNELTYLKAAIIRADSGTATQTSPGFFQGYLNQFGPTFTVFAPTDDAFKTILRGLITQALMSQGLDLSTALTQATALSSSSDVFNNSALFPVLTAKTVKGILAYHILGNIVFTNNFPTAETSVPSLLKLNPDDPAAIPLNVKIKAAFGTPFVSAASVKGLANSTAANIIIDNRPEPTGSSDQFYVNGVLHKIDAVLMPQ